MYTQEAVQVATSVDVAVAVALISGAVAIIGLIVNNIVNYYLKKKEIKNKALTELRTKMLSSYEKLVGLIFNFKRLAETDDEIESSVLHNIVEEMNKSIILNSSNNIIAKWSNLLNEINADEADYNKGRRVMAQLLIAIRADLGVGGNYPIFEKDIINILTTETKAFME